MRRVHVRLYLCFNGGGAGVVLRAGVAAVRRLLELGEKLGVRLRLHPAADHARLVVVHVAVAAAFAPRRRLLSGTGGGNRGHCHVGKINGQGGGG